MRRRAGIWTTIILAAAVTAGVPGCGGGTEEVAEPTPAPMADDDSEARALAERAKAALGILPESAATEEQPMTPARVDLGRMLYYDTRFSLNNGIACNTCHQLDNFGVDGEPTSPGHEGVRGERNSPTVYNAALHTAQFWDGRAADVEEQAKGPVLNPVEMGMPDEAYVLRVMKSIPDYPGLFAAAFPEAEGEVVTFDNFAVAVGAFERGLITPGRFDDFLGGDYDALDEDEQAGLELFMDLGCITCHSGPVVGGQMFQKLGLIQPYETEDTGRFKVTGNEADKYFFKVPSLRNVAETGPWLHDGSITDLGEMVRIMARHQLGKELDDEQVRLLVAFLESLTGRIDEGYVAQPTLPESGADTPGPSTS
jgi:cytochrome c peroxidase